MATSSPTATFEVDPTGRILTWQEEALSVLGLSPQEALGRACFFCVGFRDAQDEAVCHADCPLLASARSRQPASDQRILFRRQGQKDSPTLVTSTVFEKADRSYAVIHAVREVAAQEALTGSETRVLALLLDGKDTPSIAEAMAIRLSTARTHIRNLLSKTGAKSRLEVLARVRRGNL